MAHPIKLAVNFRLRDITPFCRVFILDRPSGPREVKLRPGASEFTLDLNENARFFSVLVQGPSNLWEANGHFAHSGGGKIALVGRPPEFELLTANEPVPKIKTHLSLFRDATGTVVHALYPAPPGFNPWKFDNFNGFHYVSQSWRPNGPLRGAFERRSGRFGTFDVVLELKVLPVPRLFAVCWPDSISFDHPIPMLLYFRPGATQNRKFYSVPSNSYPFGRRYLESGIQNFLRYCGDPVLRDKWCMGLPMQIAAAGKAAVLVLPLPKVDAELGRLHESGIGQALMEEITWLVGRLKGRFAAPPALGRIALGCFSNGVILMEQFLASNAGTPLFLDKLSEIYAFDPRPPDVPNIRSWRIAKSARAGASRDNRDRVIRFYNQWPVRPFPTEDQVFTTRAELPQQEWAAAGAKGDAHHLIPRTMLTHAMRESLFPVGGPAPAAVAREAKSDARARVDLELEADWTEELEVV
jgi:hypothetical protein